MVLDALSSVFQLRITLAIRGVQDNRGLSNISHLQSSYRNKKEVTVNTTKLIAPPVTGLCRPLLPVLTTNTPTPSVPTETVSISSAIIGSTLNKEEELIAHSQQLMQRIFLSHDDAL